MKRKLTVGEIFALVTENFVFVVAAVVLFLKTSELFSIFAPKTIFGYTGLEPVYGFVTALLVEGLLIAVKYSLPHTKKAEAYAYNIVLIVVTFAISAIAQVTDGMFIRNTLSAQPAAIQMAISVGIPLVPSAILALALGKTVFEHMPEGSVPARTAGFTPKQQTQIETVQYAADTSGMSVRRNELTAEDKEFIAGHSARQIAARFGTSGRTARDWRKAVKDGKL